MVIMSAFQAEDGGSIPLTRSLKIKAAHPAAFCINIYDCSIINLVNNNNI